MSYFFSWLNIPLIEIALKINYSDMYNSIFDYEDKFILAQYISQTEGLYIYWYPTSLYLSSREFENSIDILLCTITATQSKVVLFDAFDFNSVFVPEKIIRLLRYALYMPSSVKNYGLVHSHRLYGMITLEIILQQLSDIRISIHKFDERQTGIKWLLSINNPTL
jgi:hypothetical protein